MGAFGDRHKGICLGFNLHKERRKPQEVKYAAKRVHEQLDDKGVLAGLSDDLKKCFFARSTITAGTRKSIGSL